MKKNGFTLVELLAVIVIMAILLTIAVPNVIGVSKKIRKNMYCSKIEDIESAAKLYGNDYIDEIEKAGNSLTIYVYTLVENNLFKKETDGCVLRSNNNYCIKDPRDGSMMDNDSIKITKKDKRITAEYDSNKKSVCNE